MVEGISYESSRNYRDLAHETPLREYQTDAMFAVRNAVIKAGSFLRFRPSSLVALRGFSDSAVSTTSSPSEPAEQGDPEVIEFIKKVVFCIGE